MEGDVYIIKLGVLQPMLRQAQQTCNRLRVFSDPVEGFQVLNLKYYGHLLWFN